MYKHKIIVFLTTIILSLLHAGCTNRNRINYTDISEKGELVVAMDIDIPGHFRQEESKQGYHYDMLQSYARSLGVTLRIITGRTQAECRRMLASGEVDVIASLVPDMECEAAVMPIYTTSYVILAGPEDHKAAHRHKSRLSFGDFKGKRVLISAGFKASEHYDILMDSLAESHKYISANNMPEMMAALNDNEYDYLICEKSEAVSGMDIHDGLRTVYDFPDRIAVHVALSPSVRGLKEDFTSWLAEYRSSDEHNRLNELYFYTPAPARHRTYGKAHKNQKISQHDDVIRRVAEHEQLDWRLLSAIAYHESRFKEHVVSAKGAMGIMQIMPVVARHFNVPEENIADTETNVRLAAKLLKNIEKTIKLPASTSFRDRMSIVLACYNAGVGHIADARRLAAKYGRDANSWDDISRFLELKSEPEYYCDEVVRNGVFRGSRQTTAFVRNVMGQYDSYCLIAQN